MALRPDSPVDCAELAGSAQAKLAEVDAKIQALSELRASLVDLLGSCCVPGRGSGPCPRVQAHVEAPAAR
jgi:hypothetical protein